MRVFRCLAFIALLPVTAVHAELRLCNDTPFKLGTAVGYFLGGAWTSKGWWTIDAGDCMVPIGGDLGNRYYYVHAHAVDASYKWDGDYTFCSTNQAFTIAGSSDCTDRGFETTRFLQLDLNGATSYTQRLTCEGCKVKTGWYLTYALRDVPGGVTLDGNTFTTPTTGWAKVDFSGDTLYATLTVDADVSALQHGLPDIIRAHVNNNDDCDYILNMHTISLSPYGGSLRVYAAGHYENWDCPEIETDFGDIEFGKYRIFEQNGDATAILTPHTNGSGVSMDVNVVDMNADGVLGNLMNNGWFGPWIRDMIMESIPQAIELGRIEDLLPPELQGFPLRLLDISFYDRGGGRLGLRTSAKVTVSSDYAKGVWDRLQQ